MEAWQSRVRRTLIASVPFDIAEQRSLGSPSWIWNSIVNGTRPKTTPTDAREDLVLLLDMIAAMRSASETACD